MAVSKIKLYLTRALCILLLLAGGCVIYHGLDYVMSDDTDSQTRVNFHEYFSADKADILFVGSSHSVRAINAVHMTEKMGQEVYNLSTSGQEPIQGYYAVKGALADTDKQVKRVFFEVSYSRFLKDEEDEVGTYIISDYLTSPIVRAQMITDLLSPENYVHGFSRLRRNTNPQDPSDLENMAWLYGEKQKDKYRLYQGDSKYMGRGQWDVDDPWGFGSTIAVNVNSKKYEDFTPDEIVPMQWEYFLKVIDLCREKGVDLTFYVTPYSEFYVREFTHYDEVAEYFRKTCMENGVEFVDLNLVKEEYLPIDMMDFSDPDHVDASMSDEIGDFFALYMNEPNGDYYYASTEERYPDTTKIRAIGFDRAFVTDYGEFRSRHDAEDEDDINYVRIDITAYPEEGAKTDARMWSTYKHGDNTWEDKTEVPGEKIDEYRTRFQIPYDDDYETTYSIYLYEPGTDKLLYKAITDFDMS